MRLSHDGLILDFAIAVVTLTHNNLKDYFRSIVFNFMLVMPFLCLLGSILCFDDNYILPSLVFSEELLTLLLINCFCLAILRRINKRSYLNLRYVIYCLLVLAYLGVNRGLSGDMKYLVFCSCAFVGVRCRYISYLIITCFRCGLVLCLAIEVSLTITSFDNIIYCFIISIVNVLLIIFCTQCRT